MYLALNATICQSMRRELVEGNKLMLNPLLSFNYSNDFCCHQHLLITVNFLYYSI